MPKLVLGFSFEGESVRPEVLPRSLSGIEQMLDQIYTRHDRQYYPGVKDLTLTLIWSLGVVSSATRKGLSGKVPRYLADSFAWWVALCNFLQFDIEEILWEKYPAACIYCRARKNCSCEGVKFGFEQESLSSFRANTRRRPKTMRGWQQMFDRIYGMENSKRGFDFAMGRFPEEERELIECILPSIEDRYHLGMELADIGARLFALANLLKIDLEKIFLSFYCGVCPSCQRNSCRCDPRKR